MSESAVQIQRKLDNASDLRSVVRTMKALAASNIGQFERAVRSLADYAGSVTLGIGLCLRESKRFPKSVSDKTAASSRTVIVFGTDQGLVGQFNDEIAKFTHKQLAQTPGTHRVWAVGERIHSRLKENGLNPEVLFDLPTSVKSIHLLIERILLTYEKEATNSELSLFYNRSSTSPLYSSFSLKLFPLDRTWEQEMMAKPWPTLQLPEALGKKTLNALVREYLFISLYRACAESLQAENASRLASMQRADRNIGELIERLTNTSHHLRQNQIDEELFDVVSGFESIAKQNQSPEIL